MNIHVWHIGLEIAFSCMIFYAIFPWSRRDKCIQKLLNSTVCTEKQLLEIIQIYLAVSDLLCRSTILWSYRCCKFYWTSIFNMIVEQVKNVVRLGLKPRTSHTTNFATKPLIISLTFNYLIPGIAAATH